MGGLMWVEKSRVGNTVGRVERGVMVQSVE